MPRFVSFLVLASLTLGSLLTWAEKAPHILICQSQSIKLYDEAVAAFQMACPYKTTTLDLSTLDETEAAREIRTVNPSVIIAVSKDDQQKVRNIKDTPIISLLVDEYETDRGGRNNMTGIDLFVDPRVELITISRILPTIKRIGLFYDPAKSAKLVADLQAAAKSLGITLVVEPISKPSDVRDITNFAGRIDAMLLVPDTTSVTPETIEVIGHFSLENKVPVVSFAPKYLGTGALLSIATTVANVGRRAGAICRDITHGKKVRDIPIAHNTEPAVTVNMKIARKLGISVNKDAVKGLIVIE